MDVSRKTSGLIRPNLTNGSRLSLSIRRITGLHGRLIPYVLKHRRTILLGVIIIVLLIEVFEHLLILTSGEWMHIIYDAGLSILLVPTGTWLLLRLLESTETERMQVTHDNKLRVDFSQKLGSARSWDELMRCLVEYPHQVAPEANITLYVLCPGSQHMQPEAACTRDGAVTLKPVVALPPDSLPVGSLPQLLLQNGTSAHNPQPGNGSAHFANAVNHAPLPPHRYDLPVTRNEQQIGVIKLEYPLDSAPSRLEVRALKSAAPVMALALEGALLQALAVEQAAASETQRQQIAQNLHDTLAQNISYLRLKLDQLTGENTIREIGAVLQELERMRATADEAYQQVRDTLDELNPIRAEDLATTLKKQAQAISQRTGFNLRCDQVGAPYPLPGAIRQQIVYIVREALHNIEKHAQANQVHLQLLWLETEIIIKITDDGVGFDPLSVTSEGHYGLWIMQQRAQEIGGTLKVTPGEEQGTEVTLWAPRPLYPVGPGD